MMYILTQEEYDALKSEQKRQRQLSDKKLQDLCTKIADTMPVKWGWSRVEEPKPWGCIITAYKNEEEWYCDSCPVLEICPYNGKSFSK